MNRRTFMRHCAAGAAGLCGAARAVTETRQSERPNFVFFVVDDQRNTTLGCAGDRLVQTPRIDALAAAGVRFRNAFVTTSICAASRASILTGLTERTHGYTFGTPPVPEVFTRTSYPALLRQAGYRTAHIGKFGVKMAGQKDAGLFDVFENRDRPYVRKQKDGSTRHIDAINCEQAVEFVESCSQDAPFCLTLCFSSGHAEDADKENHYPCIDEVKGMYDDVTFPEPRLNDPAIFESQPDFLKNSLNRERFFWRWDTPAKYQKNMRGYYRLLSGVDLMIGRVLDALEAKGLAENTVVVYIGDNGYYMGDRGFAGKWSHYEESLRVPLIVYDPRQDARGRTVDGMALNIDVPATMLDLAGVAPPAHYQGASLRPWLEGRVPAGWRTDFFAEHRMDHPKLPKWEGVRGTRYVYARYDGQAPPYEFLHDLVRDPDQLTNLAHAPEAADTLEALRKRCDSLRDGCVMARERAVGKP